MIKGFPCQVSKVSHHKQKHGHAKVHVYGLDIFTGQKKEDFFPASHNVPCPVVKRLELEVVSMEDGFISYIDDEGDI